MANRGLLGFRHAEIFRQTKGKFRSTTKLSVSNIFLSMSNILKCLSLQLHGAIYRPVSFALMLRYCANLKAMRYESTSFNRIAADKSHRVISA